MRDDNSHPLDIIMSNPIPNLYPARKGDIRRKCPVCLKEFWAVRITAVYCSSKCRQRAHRNPPLEKRITELYDTARNALMGLIAVVDRSSFEGYRAKRSLESLVRTLIEHLPDDARRMIYDAISEDFHRLRDK